MEGWSTRREQVDKGRVGVRCRRGGLALCGFVRDLIELVGRRALSPERYSRSLHYRPRDSSAAQKFSSVVSNSMAHTQYLKTQSHASFCTSAAKLDSEEGDEEPQRINVTFVDKDGEEKHISVPEGFSMLEAAHDNDIDLEGACEGTMACSTCHVIVMDEDQYNKLPDPVDEELDMLDLAFGLTKTSRLGCQVIAKRELDGLRLALPSATS
ncbi:adrenodoxin-like protein 2, mitochondrial [Salvia splendens]|uniref:adrenodoxin-like protein 2, mitochondrial n=1 Tax=Salvia splendens TaxID=180675 RepID=UPI001C27C1FE|nr:adrenodoxin-like protein 2, mitochondrial [Salvia splendens]